MKIKILIKTIYKDYWNKFNSYKKNQIMSDR